MKEPEQQEGAQDGCRWLAHHQVSGRAHQLDQLTQCSGPTPAHQPVGTREPWGFLWVLLKSARYWMLGASALGRPRGMVWGGRREEGSGWGTHVYLWQIHFDIWQNQYNIVKLNKIKIFFKSAFFTYTISKVDPASDSARKDFTSILSLDDHFDISNPPPWGLSAASPVKTGQRVHSGPSPKPCSHNTGQLF